LSRDKEGRKKGPLTLALGEGHTAAVGLDGKEACRLLWARYITPLPTFFPNTRLGARLSRGAWFHCHQNDLVSQKWCSFVWGSRLNAFSFYLVS